MASGVFRPESPQLRRSLHDGGVDFSDVNSLPRKEHLVLAEHIGLLSSMGYSGIPSVRAG